jgi:hypothetical protein
MAITYLPIRSARRDVVKASRQMITITFTVTMSCASRADARGRSAAECLVRRRTERAECRA